MADDCRFCQILRGEVGCHAVLDEADVLAFLDARPLFLGHVLVVPRDHHETLCDLPPALLEPLFGAVRRVAVGVTAAMDAHGTFVAMNNTVSQTVPHLHVHVVPRRFKDGLRGFFWPRLRYEGEAHGAEVAARIRAAVPPAPGGGAGPPPARRPGLLPPAPSPP